MEEEKKSEFILDGAESYWNGYFIPKNANENFPGNFNLLGSV